MPSAHHEVSPQPCGSGGDSKPAAGVALSAAPGDSGKKRRVKYLEPQPVPTPSSSCLSVGSGYGARAGQDRSHFTESGCDSDDRERDVPPRKKLSSSVLRHATHSDHGGPSPVPNAQPRSDRTDSEAADAPGLSSGTSTKPTSDGPDRDEGLHRSDMDPPLSVPSPRSDRPNDSQQAQRYRNIVRLACSGTLTAIHVEHAAAKQAEQLRDLTSEVVTITRTQRGFESLLAILKYHLLGAAAPAQLGAEPFETVLLAVTLLIRMLQALAAPPMLAQRAAEADEPVDSPPTVVSVAPTTTPPPPRFVGRNSAKVEPSPVFGLCVEVLLGFGMHRCCVDVSMNDLFQGVMDLYQSTTPGHEADMAAETLLPLGHYVGQHIEMFSRSELGARCVCRLFPELKVGVKVRRRIVDKLVVLAMLPLGSKIVIRFLDHAKAVSKAAAANLLGSARTRPPLGDGKADPAAASTDAAVPPSIAFLDMAASPHGLAVCFKILEFADSSVRLTLTELIQRNAELLERTAPQLLMWAVDKPSLRSAIAVRDSSTGSDFIVPSASVSTTAASEKWFSDSAVSIYRAIPPLCVEHESGSCPNGAQCNAVHLNPGTFDVLRPKTRSCCWHHDGVNDREFERFISQRYQIVTQEQPLAVMRVSSVELAYSAGLSRLVPAAGAARAGTPNGIVCIRLGDLCKAHRRGFCKRPEQCRYIHLCAEAYDQALPHDAETSSAHAVCTSTSTPCPSTTSDPPQARRTPHGESAASGALSRNSSIRGSEHGPTPYDDIAPRVVRSRRRGAPASTCATVADSFASDRSRTPNSQSWVEVESSPTARRFAMAREMYSTGDDDVSSYHSSRPSEYSATSFPRHFAGPDRCSESEGHGGLTRRSRYSSQHSMDSSLTLLRDNCGETPTSEPDYLTVEPLSEQSHSRHARSSRLGFSTNSSVDGPRNVASFPEAPSPVASSRSWTPSHSQSSSRVHNPYSYDGDEVYTGRRSGEAAAGDPGRAVGNGVLPSAQPAGGFITHVPFSDLALPLSAIPLAHPATAPIGAPPHFQQMHLPPAPPPPPPPPPMVNPAHCQPRAQRPAGAWGPGPSAGAGRSRTLNGIPECKYFKLGCCTRGNSCTFLHVPGSAPTPKAH